MKLWKKIALKEANDQVIGIEDDGHKFQALTDYHWKIDGIDVWPSSKKYMKAGWAHTKKYTHLRDIFN